MTPAVRTLDLNLLRTFVAVADRASMTAATNVLNLTQGAVSQQIKRLEDVLGCRLFARDSRGLQLTAEGERLFGRARRILRMNDEIWADIRTDGVEGRVRLGIPPDLVHTHLTQLLTAYADLFPRVELSLTCAASPELVEAMASGLIDLAIAEEPIGAAKGECLAIERLVWVGARAGVAQAKRPLPLSMVTGACAFRAAVLGALDEHGIPWRTVSEGGSFEATTATVRADLGVSAWLASVVPSGLEILQPGSVLPPLPDFGVNLHAPTDATAAVAGLARLIRDKLTNLRARPKIELSDFSGL